MKKNTVISICIFLFFALPGLYAQFSFEGNVIRVTDGDTITVRTGEVNFRVRLHGIDAPERGQPFGTKARDALSEMVAGKVITVKVMDVDRYGRLIGLLSLGDTAVNLEMLLKGFAWHYKDYDSSKSFAEAEASARREQRGLWAEPNPVAPWDWRKKN